MSTSFETSQGTINVEVTFEPTRVILRPKSPEPPEGSVVMLMGATGTAAQRFFSDGLYHTTTGKVMTYADLFRVGSQGVFLVYRAPDDDH